MPSVHACSLRPRPLFPTSLFKPLAYSLAYFLPVLCLHTGTHVPGTHQLLALVYVQCHHSAGTHCALSKYLFYECGNYTTIPVWTSTQSLGILEGSPKEVALDLSL